MLDLTQIHIHNIRKSEERRFQGLMQSAILGVVDVVFDTHKPDQSVVDGCEYSNDELADLISRGLSADRLREIHQIK